MKLKEVAEVRSGLVLSRKEARLEEAKARYKSLTVKSLTEDGFIDTEEFVDFNSKEKLEQSYLTQTGDVIVRLTYPFTAVCIKNGMEGYLVSSLFVVIRLKSESILPEFLTLLINSNRVKNEICRLNAGRSVPVVRKSIFENLEINKISLEAQNTAVDYSNLHRKEKELLRQLADEKEILYQACLNSFIKKEDKK